MNWYKFRQNNSGGKLRGPALYVVVEAERAEFANVIAQDFGIYFDPEYERDCSCCGQRWHEAGEVDKFEHEPSLDDLSPLQFRDWDVSYTNKAGIPLAVKITLGLVQVLQAEKAKERK